SLTDDRGRTDIGKVLDGDVAVATDAGRKRHIVADYGVVLDVGIDVGGKEPPNANVGRNGAEAADNCTLTNVGGSHDDRLPADNGHRLEPCGEKALACGHARLRVSERNIEEGGRPRRGKKCVRAHDADAIQLLDAGRIVDEHDVGDIAVAATAGFQQKRHD